ncbi:helix-turn-helix domain-containing protein [Lonepinella koalarum]|uniref:Helix-turn-helix protein n=1 Tax=Lonepinella koalarum TaxID=53417 RepID=A0A4R1L074_9PAST|nr:helix-turn-helix transcriptional regulator [Lonepinella koalarum]MDH2927059.1 transcriptional regulator [Lonepinella koalarum]TCK70280.1 helix-turn-helix protein [Lonepinella koalarum]TFJ89327.1 XRE family transcriptional regulator [Lonepinella koalarum]
MAQLQYINDKQGSPLFVLLPIEEYQLLQQYKAISTNDTSNDEHWQDVEYIKGDNDNELIPHEVLTLMIDDDISLLGAWRKYRNLSQSEVAKQTGLSQSAISQAERKESRPQQKTLERLSKIYQVKPEQLTL